MNLETIEVLESLLRGWCINGRFECGNAWTAERDDNERPLEAATLGELLEMIEEANGG